MKGRWLTLPAALVLVGAALSGAAAADGGSGVRGRAAWRGELVPGVVVYAFDSTDGGFQQGAVARSEPTATDGTYSLALPPGGYTLVAASGDDPQPLPPRPGDYYCYYSGSPVVVQDGAWSPVGFNLVKVSTEGRGRGTRAAIQGVVTYRDGPLERLYLYLYRDAGQGFRGPGLSTVPVGSGGRFKVAVSPGAYYVIARKRLRGGMYGPMEIGDYFNYYPGNPVTVEEKEVVTLELETVTRISQLEEGDVALPTIYGTVTGPDDAGLPGIRVMLYSPGEHRGRPLYFSEPTGDDGRFQLPVPVTGSYSVVARETFGGPAAPGERFGLYDSGTPVSVEKGKDVKGLHIVVEVTQ